MKNTTWEILIIIIVFILILIVIGIILYGYFTNRNNQVYTSSAGTFLSPCTNNVCNTGLTCDPASYLCKYSENESCQTTSQCATPLSCSGICTSGPFGGLNQYCPCNQGYSCVSTGTSNQCKGDGGSACQVNADCISLICNENVCSDTAANGLPCIVNDACESGNCSNGFCQPPNVTTGEVNAVCNESLNCNEGLICNNGVCATSTQGLLEACSTTNACVEPLQCLNSQNQQCSDNLPTCLCVFPTPNPNDSNVCIDGMVENTVSPFNCYNVQACDFDYQCQNGNSCTGPGTLSLIDFSGNYIGATNTSINPISSTSSFTANKLFGVPNNGVDQIYAVDPNTGLWLLQYNYTTNATSTWTLIFPNVVNGMNLVDVAYNGIFMIVAFELNGSYMLFTYNGSFIPYNITQGSTSVQYSNNVPLTISFIDISIQNDILIVSNSSLYIKPYNVTTYQLISQVGGLARFYTSQGTPQSNYVYINTSSQLQYSGALTNTTPNSTISYEVFDFSVSGTSCMMVTSSNGNYILLAGTNQINTPIPYQGSNLTRSLVIESRYYVIARGSCVSQSIQTPRYLQS